ncbi:hypothetical protein [Vibrio sp. SCSIO 43155]|uniref:hypothetical protein n=1 Tax=Vibrio TaxID=662 RepID=UPI00207627FB|nr:hypothetical protein [Vibrio sp. SCSIO 43155]USD58592.1 hypothetical protein J4N44_26945 [Vibrio sp. SCSIO 43155]
MFVVATVTEYDLIGLEDDQVKKSLLKSKDKHLVLSGQQSLCKKYVKSISGVPSIFIPFGEEEELIQALKSVELIPNDLEYCVEDVAEGAMWISVEGHDAALNIDVSLSFEE